MIVPRSPRPRALLARRAGEPPAQPLGGELDRRQGFLISWAIRLRDLAPRRHALGFRSRQVRSRTTTVPASRRRERGARSWRPSAWRPWRRGRAADRPRDQESPDADPALRPAAAPAARPHAGRGSASWPRRPRRSSTRSTGSSAWWTSSRASRGMPVLAPRPTDVRPADRQRREPLPRSHPALSITTRSIPKICRCSRSIPITSSARC